MKFRTAWKGSAFASLSAFVVALVGSTSDADADSLRGICPDPIVIQTDWFPTPERAAAYQLIGPGGQIDAEKGRYTGPLGDTGVSVEVRFGGPYTGFAPFTAVMYQDQSIMLGYMPTDEAVQNFEKQPTISVLATLDINPQVLIFDPATYDFHTIADIGKSDATVLYFEGLPFMDFLLERGMLRHDQIDGGYDGSPARFLASDGKLIFQGYASNEPYRYENDIEGWKRPVKSLLINDAGYEIYPENLAVRPEILQERHECLTKLVPMIQQAMVDYVKNPGPTNDTLIKIGEAIKVPVPLTPGGNAYAVKTMLDLKIMSNGSNATVGDFDMARTQRVIDDQLRPVFASRGNPIREGLKAEEIQTNEFIDPHIGL
jgi:hypothetical protein